MMQGAENGNQESAGNKMRRKLFVISIIIFQLIVFLACQVISAYIADSHYTGQASKTWAGQSGERFAQLAVYFPHSYDFSEESVYTLRNSLEKTLQASSIEADENRRLYTDAWSGESTVQITGKQGSANATAIGTGGDFFLFHPLILRDGSYISAGDIMRDRVVLDEELAWRLFGSVYLTGMNVTINGKPFVISGVVSRENGFGYDKAYSSGAGLFMSFEALNEISKEQTGSPARIVSYEIVMPDIVTDFALSSVKEILSSDKLYLIDNTDRFGYTRIFKIIGSFGERSMRTGSVEMPYWENAARYAEDWLALLLFVSIVMLICPVIFGIIYFIKSVKFMISKIKKLVFKLIKMRDDRAYRIYMEKQNTA